MAASSSHISYTHLQEIPPREHLVQGQEARGVALPTALRTCIIVTRPTCGSSRSAWIGVDIGVICPITRRLRPWYYCWVLDVVVCTEPEVGLYCLEQPPQGGATQLVVLDIVFETGLAAEEILCVIGVVVREGKEEGKVCIKIRDKG